MKKPRPRKGAARGVTNQKSHNLNNAVRFALQVAHAILDKSRSFDDLGLHGLPDVWIVPEAVAA